LAANFNVFIINLPKFVQFKEYQGKSGVDHARVLFKSFVQSEIFTTISGYLSTSIVLKYF